jgi:hypothetical protein
VKKISLTTKAILLLLGLGFYITFFVIKLNYAIPMGAVVNNLSTDMYTVTPQGRTDLGGRIITISLSAAQQDSAWKGYVGNVSGSLVLKNSGGYSIYEWVLNTSTISGNIFVSRSNSVTWANIRCANSTIVESEDTFFGFTTATADNINKTFNYTAHKSMTVSQVGTIANDTCPSMATYINGSRQTQNSAALFQELLLYDQTNLVYGTFVDKASWSYNNNATAPTVYDFQLIVAENRTTLTGTTYYFYADIS